MRKVERLAAALAVVIGATAATASDTSSCPLSYETFEYGVPHTDLDACPASMATDGTYCRLSLVAEVATVFVFSEADDCLVASRAFEGDEYSLSLE